MEHRAGLSAPGTIGGRRARSGARRPTQHLPQPKCFPQKMLLRLPSSPHFSVLPPLLRGAPSSDLGRGRDPDRFSTLGLGIPAQVHSGAWDTPTHRYLELVPEGWQPGWALVIPC